MKGSYQLRDSEIDELIERGHREARERFERQCFEMGQAWAQEVERRREELVMCVLARQPAATRR